MKPSLYASYIYERLGKDIIESDKGFLTYCYLKDGVYIEDIYVKPEFRKEGIASKMADKVAEIAKSKNYKKLYGTVVPSTNGSTESMKALLSYGFKLTHNEFNTIWLVKELGE